MVNPYLTMDIDTEPFNLYCSCNTSLRCYNRDGFVKNILCRLVHREAETLAMWASRVVKDRSEDDV